MVCSVFQLYLAHNLYSTCSIGIHVAKKYLVGVWSIFIHMVMYWRLCRLTFVCLFLTSCSAMERGNINEHFWILSFCENSRTNLFLRNEPFFKKKGSKYRASVVQSLYSQPYPYCYLEFYCITFQPHLTYLVCWWCKVTYSFLNL